MLNSRVAAMLLAACGPMTTAFGADSLDGLAKALSGGAPHLDLRLRYEHVGQNNALKDADAYTLRTRLGYTTGKWNLLDAMAEYEGVVYLGDEAYNSTRNGKTGFSTVADPKGNELNQAWVRYTGLPGTTLKYGRSRLILDNARFVGNVGWRQNEQTYDGFFFTNASLPKTTVNYAYLTDVNNPTFLSFRLHAQLINIAFAPAPWLKLVAYDYLLNFQDNVAARQDTQTPGLRATGAAPIGPGKLNYALEYARQLPYKDAPDLATASYYLAELGYGVPAVNGKLGYEVLGSNGGQYGFQTPLATLHAFQGWADQFLVTPDTGVRDLYASIGGGIVKIALQAVWHRFKAAEGGAHYGNELDLLASYPLGKSASVGANYADYVADRFSVRTRKVWAWFEYRV